ncbi:hypothetical protein HC766_05710 [Candidatus Gracilibacteria bacterium]|nr:hypothetical protein [Candidatus Gracilibacteria bacterium]
MILITNILVSIYQIILGKSIGLYFIGEKYLYVEMIGVAKQSIFGSLILRGYGLMSHPNVLGFFGVILFWLYISSKNIKQQISSIFSRESVILILISFSRTALFCFLISITKNLFSKKNSTKIFSLLILVFVLVIFFSRFAESDNYRIEDTKRFIYTYSNSKVEEKLFGIGLGQYSSYLYKNFQLANWQYQPVHNLFLQLFFEIGLIPLILIFNITYYYTSKQNESNPLKMLTE